MKQAERYQIHLRDIFESGLKATTLKQRLSKSLYTPEWEAFSAILKSERECKGVTQKELSKLLSQPQSFVSKFESSQRKLDLRQFILYVEALNSDPAKVFALVLKEIKILSKKKRQARKR